MRLRERSTLLKGYVDSGVSPVTAFIVVHLHQKTHENTLLILGANMHDRVDRRLGRRFGRRFGRHFGRHFGRRKRRVRLVVYGCIY